MTPLNGGNILRLPLDAIEAGTRLRAVSPAQLENLLLMAEDTGLTTPIHVRKNGTAYQLIDGAHRLAAAKRLGLPDIACLAFACRQDEARAMEASNNLGAARMTPLQTAVFAASWKRDYYEKHPERKPGLFKGNRYTGKLVREETSLTNSVAQAFGITERRARHILACGERLVPEDASALEGAARRVSMEDLDVIGRIGEPEERASVVRALVADHKLKAARARRQYRAANGGAPIMVKSGVETEFKALSTAWERAGVAARKRFCLEKARDIWDAQSKGAALPDWKDAVE